MKIGLVGLGQMGFNLMLNLLDHDHEVVAWNRSPEKREAAKKNSKANVVDSIEELVDSLPEEKIIISIISAGEAIDKLFFGEDGKSGLAALLKAGDIIIDMANSHYKDSARRADRLAKMGIAMLDTGISGGLEGARHGACMMVGGDETAYKKVAPLFADVTVENGYGHFGPSGAGHFVKMVHNGIEYGMMQAIAEGVSLIDAKPEYDPDMAKLLDVWNHGSIIQSRLVGFLREAYLQDPGLKNEEAEIGSLGTGKWTAQEALELGVPLTVITHALFARYNSRFDNFIGWRAVSAMRRVFGGHSGKDREGK